MDDWKYGKISYDLLTEEIPKDPTKYDKWNEIMAEIYAEEDNKENGEKPLFNEEENDYVMFKVEAYEWKFWSFEHGRKRGDPPSICPIIMTEKEASDHFNCGTTWERNAGPFLAERWRKK